MYGHFKQSKATIDWIIWSIIPKFRIFFLLSFLVLPWKGGVEKAAKPTLPEVAVVALNLWLGQALESGNLGTFPSLLEGAGMLLRKVFARRCCRRWWRPWKGQRDCFTLDQIDRGFSARRAVGSKMCRARCFNRRLTNCFEKWLLQCAVLFGPVGEACMFWFFEYFPCFPQKNIFFASWTF